MTVTGTIHIPIIMIHGIMIPGIMIAGITIPGIMILTITGHHITDLLLHHYITPDPDTWLKADRQDMFLTVRSMVEDGTAI